MGALIKQGIMLLGKKGMELLFKTGLADLIRNTVKKVSTENNKEEKKETEKEEKEGTEKEEKEGLVDSIKSGVKEMLGFSKDSKQGERSGIGDYIKNSIKEVVDFIKNSIKGVIELIRKGATKGIAVGLSAMAATILPNNKALANENLEQHLNNDNKQKIAVMENEKQEVTNPWSLTKEQKEQYYKKLQNQNKAVSNEDRQKLLDAIKDYKSKNPGQKVNVAKLGPEYQEIWGKMRTEDMKAKAEARKAEMKDKKEQENDELTR